MTYYTYHEDPDTVDGSKVFVFATSLKGDMKLGYGPIAVKRHGAQIGRPMGYNVLGGVGRSFAIPFKDKDGYDLSTTSILVNIDEFIRHTVNVPYETYHITDVTKVIPRVQPKVIMRLFIGCHSNCIFPSSWRETIEPPTALIEEPIENRTDIILKTNY